MMRIHDCSKCKYEEDKEYSRRCWSCRNGSACEFVPKKGYKECDHKSCVPKGHGVAL